MSRRSRRISQDLLDNYRQGSNVRGAQLHTFNVETNNVSTQRTKTRDNRHLWCGRHPNDEEMDLPPPKSQASQPSARLDSDDERDALDVQCSIAPDLSDDREENEILPRKTQSRRLDLRTKMKSTSKRSK